MLLTITTSLLFTELKKNADNGLPANMKSFWDIWEIRGMILLSLFLQVVLVALGNRLRSKGSAKNFIVWVTYLSADWIATTSLGFLMRSDKKRFTELAVFWAPFLLLHLGGPDSITAYSLEDNELWLRHLLGFCFQVTVVIFVLCKFQANYRITCLAILIFMAAIIKYGERIWSLWSASDNKLKQSLYSLSTIHKLKFMSRDHASEDLDRHIQEICDNPEARNIHVAYTLLLFFKPLFLDLNLILLEEFVEERGFSKACSSTVKLIDTEKRLLYDEIYTKRPLLNTSIGMILRGISFLCSFSALIAFLFFVGVDVAWKQHSTPDIVISFLLLLGAVALETFSILAHCLSDWPLLWATMRKNRLSNLICKANATKLTSNYDQDTMFIPQYNIIDSCLKFNPIPYMDHENFLKKYLCITWEKIELEKNIHTHLEKQLEAYTERVNDHHQHGKEDYSFGFIASVLEKNLPDDHRSDYESKGFGRVMRLAGFEECLIIWHLVTDICYHVDAEAQNFKDKYLPYYKTSKLLSDYMLYIMVSQSSMIVSKGSHEFTIRKACNHLLYLLSRNRGEGLDSGKAGRIAYKARHTFIPIVNSRLKDAVEIVRWLRDSWITEERLALIRDVWVEILAHVAMHCPGREHRQCLGRGGDLLTFVFLFMAHHGLSSKIHLIPLRNCLSWQNDVYRPQPLYEWAMQFRVEGW